MEASGPNIKSTAAPRDFAKLFEQKRWAELLSALRLSLRSSLAADYGFPDSATDREIIRSVNHESGRAAGEAEENLPPAVNPELPGLFRGVASAFEAAAFAGRNIDGSVVAGLYQRFQTLISTPRRREE